MYRILLMIRGGAKPLMTPYIAPETDNPGQKEIFGTTSKAVLAETVRELLKIYPSDSERKITGVIFLITDVRCKL